MSLFRLDASIRVEGSHSRAIADIVEQEWRDAHPGESVIRRHAGVDPGQGVGHRRLRRADARGVTHG